MPAHPYLPSQAPIPILLTFGVFVAASLVPILRGANLQVNEWSWVDRG